MTLEPAAHLFPVSVKGVAVQDGKVLLLENGPAELIPYSRRAAIACAQASASACVVSTCRS